MLERAAENFPTLTLVPSRQRRIEEILSAIAFEMMSREIYDYVVDQRDIVEVVHELRQVVCVKG